MLIYQMNIRNTCLLYTSPYFSGTITTAKVDLGITLSKPISSGYTITSRFGQRSSGTHTGLDIAAPMGTNIHAAASGTCLLYTSRCV